MSVAAAALPRTGVARVIRLAGPDDDWNGEPPAIFGVPMGTSTQDSLPLGLDLVADPARIELRLVNGTPSPAKAWAARFAQVLVEVMAGDRNPHQLVRFTSPAVLAAISERATAVSSMATPGQRRVRARAQVRSVHCFQPDDATAEISVHLRHGERSRAIAARLERQDGRWICVAIELG